mmetsp:Transcript_1375/g.4776  ORF Transcript_1375/g.4776 Transcript_1375/m.4776 type:complete len:1095 (-) Transcript_1375:94-3378(-)
MWPQQPHPQSHPQGQPGQQQQLRFPAGMVPHAYPYSNPAHMYPQQHPGAYGPQGATVPPMYPAGPPQGYGMLQSGGMAQAHGAFPQYSHQQQQQQMAAAYAQHMQLQQAQARAQAETEQRRREDAAFGSLLGATGTNLAPTKPSSGPSLGAPAYPMPTGSAAVYGQNPVTQQTVASAGASTIYPRASILPMQASVPADEDEDDFGDFTASEAKAPEVAPPPKLDRNTPLSLELFGEDHDETPRNDSDLSTIFAPAKDDVGGGDTEDFGTFASSATVSLPDPSQTMNTRQSVPLFATGATLTPPASNSTNVELLVGQQVKYTHRDGRVLDACIKKVHYDDPPPYYTIQVVGEDSERQTVRHKLSLDAGEATSRNQPALPATVASDDDFGDFSSSEPVPSVFPAVAAASAECGSTGAVLSFPSKTNSINLAPSEEPAHIANVTAESSEEGKNSFGNFCASQKSELAVPLAPEVVSHSRQPPIDVPVLSREPGHNSDDDDFGEFTASEGPARSELNSFVKPVGPLDLNEFSLEPGREDTNHSLDGSAEAEGTNPRGTPAAALIGAGEDMTKVSVESMGTPQSSLVPGAPLGAGEEFRPASVNLFEDMVVNEYGPDAGSVAEASVASGGHASEDSKTVVHVHDLTRPLDMSLFGVSEDTPQLEDVPISLDTKIGYEEGDRGQWSEHSSTMNQERTQEQHQWQGRDRSSSDDGPVFAGDNGSHALDNLATAPSSEERVEASLAGVAVGFNSADPCKDGDVPLDMSLFGSSDAASNAKPGRDAFGFPEPPVQDNNTSVARNVEIAFPTGQSDMEVKDSLASDVSPSVIDQLHAFYTQQGEQEARRPQAPRASPAPPSPILAPVAASAEFNWSSPDQETLNGESANPVVQATGPLTAAFAQTWSILLRGCATKLESLANIIGVAHRQGFLVEFCSMDKGISLVVAAQRVRLCELLIGSVATTYQDWLGPAAADVAEARSRCHVAWTKNELDEASRLVSDSEQKHRSSAAFHQRHSLATDARKQIARLQEQGNVTTRPTDAGYGSCALCLVPVDTLASMSLPVDVWQGKRVGVPLANLLRAGLGSGVPPTFELLRKDLLAQL